MAAEALEAVVAALVAALGMAAPVAFVVGAVAVAAVAAVVVAALVALHPGTLAAVVEVVVAVGEAEPLAVRGAVLVAASVAQRQPELQLLAQLDLEAAEGPVVVHWVPHHVPYHSQDSLLCESLVEALSLKVVVDVQVVAMTLLPLLAGPCPAPY